MSLRFRNGRLVHRNGLLVPGCNACPPCIFIPPDPCDESEIQFGINDAGTLAINETIVWPSSDPGAVVIITENIARPFRVYYPALPTIRLRVEIDIIDISTSVSGANSMFGQMLLSHSPFTEPNQLARNDGGPLGGAFSGQLITKNFNGSPVDRSTTYIPDILEAEISVISVTPASATTGTATIERKIWGFTQTSPDPHRVLERNGPTTTEIEINYSCETNFSFSAGLRAAATRALGAGIPPTIEPYLRGDLHWEVEVTY